jgi:hypothetical protein
MLYMPVVEVQGKEVLPKPLEFEEREEFHARRSLEKANMGFIRKRTGHLS